MFPELFLGLAFSLYVTLLLVMPLRLGPRLALYSA
jgi:hypothetical protein